MKIISNLLFGKSMLCSGSISVNDWFRRFFVATSGNLLFIFKIRYYASITASHPLFLFMNLLFNYRILRITLLILLLFFHVYLFFKLQFTAWPELIVYSYLLQNGFSYFGDIVQPYFPTLPYLLTLVYSIFGLSVNTLRITSLIFAVISDLILLLIINRLAKGKTAVVYVSGLVYVILQVFLEGNGLWFDSATVPFLMLAFLCWMSYWKKQKIIHLVVCGILVGLAFVIKQSAIFIILLITLYLLFKKHHSRSVLFGISALIPLFILLLLFKPADIWDWNIYYPFFIMSRSPGYILYPTLKQLLTVLFLFLPLTLLLLVRQKSVWIILLWFFGALIFAFPRFAYFHLQPVLPFLIFCMVLVYNRLPQIHALIIIGFYLLGICMLFTKFYERNHDLPVRFFEPSVYEAAATFAQVIPEKSPVFFYNDMGNVLVVGGFVPPKPWASTFPWYMEIPELQNKIINSLELEKVRWVVLSPFKNDGPYVPGSYRPQTIDYYLKRNYIQRQIIDTFVLLERKSPF